MPDEKATPFQTVTLLGDDEPHNLAQGLVRIHRAITRGLEVARQQCHAYASGQRGGASSPAGFADCLQALASVLHGHHTGEDAVAFPALRGRFPEVPWELLTEEHSTAAPILADINGRATSIRQQPTFDAWLPLAKSLDQLAALWKPHHEREEAAFTVSALGRVVSADEQATLVDKMTAHAEEHSGPAYLVVPFILYNLDGGDRRAMGALFPPVVTQELVPVVWEDKWSPMKPFLLT